MTNHDSARHSPIRATGSEYVCDMVAWEFAKGDGFHAPRNAVKVIFSRHGFGNCIEGGAMEPGIALLRSRTAGGVHKGRGIVVEPMDAPNKDTPAALGVYLKLTKNGEGGDAFPPGARVRIDPTTGRAVALPPEGAASEPRCFAVAEQLAKKTNELIGEVRNKELSAALTEAGNSIYWAPFRTAGGTYVVYNPFATRFRALLDDLEALGNFWGTVQPLYVDEGGRTLRNVVRASENDLTARVAELTEKLAKAREKGLRSDAVKNQIAECEDLVIRAQLFRTVLRENADKIAEQVEAIRKAFGSEDFGKKTGDSTEFDEVKALAGKPVAAVAAEPEAPKSAPRPVEPREPSVDDDPDELFSV